MEYNKRKWFLCAVVVAGMCLLTTGHVWAFAYGSSWGRVDGIVNPSGSNDRLIWNTENPEDWLLHAEADVYHMHPPLTHNWGEDSELWDPTGDGVASIGPVSTGCLAEVLWVEAGVATELGLYDYTAPWVDIDTPGDVYSYAHDIPGSYSDAAGLGQHDNLFWILYDGPGEVPESTQVTISLEGTWNLAGDSDPDDNWWADWYATAEVYEAPTLTTMGWDDEYHFLSGPGYNADSGSVNIWFDVTLEYNTPYAFRFWLDSETHAEAIPEPGTVCLLGLGGLALLKKRRT